MKKAEADYLILCEINALVSALIGAVRKKSKNLEEQDISFFAKHCKIFMKTIFFLFWINAAKIRETPLQGRFLTNMII